MVQPYQRVAERVYKRKKTGILGINFKKIKLHTIVYLDYHNIFVGILEFSVNKIRFHVTFIFWVKVIFLGEKAL